jgi:hypothetical protein
VPAENYSVTTGTVGQGTITLAPNQATYPEGTEVTVSAIAESGWRFAQWSGDLTGSAPAANLLIDSHKTVTATFEQLTYTVQIELVGGSTGVVGGSVRAEPPGPYLYGQEVTLTALPDDGYIFVGWEITEAMQQAANAPVAEPRINVVVTTDLTVIANFRASSTLYLPLIVIEP